MCCVRLGNHEQSGRVFVEAMDDAGPARAADSRQAVAAVCEKRIDKCPAAIAWRRVHDEARRLVVDDQACILVYDVERDVLWGGGHRLGRGNSEMDPFSNVDLSPRVQDRRGTDRDMALTDQSLQARAAHIGELTGQHAIETGAGIGLADLK